MPIEIFVPKNFSRRSVALIETANDIIAEYLDQGFSLTLRQLYYQFVARGIIENSQKSYKNLGALINDARLAGLIDWYAIEDRTRNIRSNAHWESPADILRACENQFAYDKWKEQRYQPEVWIEKDALVGVIAGTCNELDVPYFACRGYSSQSELWRAGKRFERAIDRDQLPVVFHLGDHDPSGIDMTRDNADRLAMFARDGVEVRRLALNWDQVEEHRPPPNPAKLTDSRANGYIARFGHSSWELDALEPALIADLIRHAVEAIRDDELWQEAIAMEESAKARLADFRAQLESEEDGEDD